MRCFVLVAALVLVAGCATGPYSPVESENLNGDKLIYLEQADRIPKDVLVEAWKSQVPKTGVVSAQGLTTDIVSTIVSSVVKEVVSMVPDITGGYQNERMNEALLSRRALMRGYQGEELKEIVALLKEMGFVVEYMTPQGKGK